MRRSEPLEPLWSVGMGDQSAVANGSADVLGWGSTAGST